MKIVLRGLVNFFGRKWKQNKERKLLSVFLVEKKKDCREFSGRGGRERFDSCLGKERGRVLFHLSAIRELFTLCFLLVFSTLLTKVAHECCDYGFFHISSMETFSFNNHVSFSL